MSKDLKIRILVVLIVLVASIFFAFPLEKRINLGLDLKGGMHLILKVETEKLDPNAKKDAVIRAIEILRNRIDGLGVAEPVIQRQGEDQIIIQLPGITDRNSAIRMIGQVASLEFYLVNDNPDLLKQALQGTIPAGYLLKYTKEGSKPLLIEAQPAMKGEAIADARVDFDNAGFGEPRIQLTFNAKGAKEFADLTRKHVNERLAIALDGDVLSAPNIKEPILSGRGEITGQFTFEEASLLALALRSGSLPAPMHVEEERTVGPLLGQDSINAGVLATIVGGILVVIFMAGYYLLAGIITDIALIMNLFMILGIMGLLKTLLPESQVTLSLPGIAGIILTLGMAVDANVLINERIREELSNGRPLHASIANGYNRAFSAIFDSNLTTLIAAFMLFQFGSGQIKGFAVTLSIGLIASMFTALYVTRTIFMVLLESRRLKSLPMLQLFKNSKIDFVGKRYLFMAASALLVIVVLVNFFQNQNRAYGIDFAGGQLQEYRFDKKVNADEIRGVLDSNGIKDIIIQITNVKVPGSAENQQHVIINSSKDTFEQVSSALTAKLPNNKFQVLRIEKVGPIAGQILRKKAIWAILLALGGILVYVGFRFRHFDFAVAGVIALFHDVIVALGLCVLMGRQVDLLMVTALLTIAGYSINDTIVIYDRIRENMPRMRKSSLAEIINVSVNQCFSRTILTSLVTLLVVITLFILGGEVLNTFSLCLLIGFIAGVYSTVFIASPLVLAWQKK
jgi:SecD/SecF fusion protein